MLPLTTIRRARLLTNPGRVLVRTGQMVTATDVIAETYLPEQHYLLDVRRALGITSVKKAQSLIQRREGEKIQKGDVIAETGGLFSRVIRAPYDGVIVAVGGSQVWIEALGEPFKLRAGMPGTVTDVIADRGAILETSGALVQAVWGNGLVDLGMLLSLARTPEDELTRDRLDVSMRGAVVLGGYVDKAEVLKAAADLQLRGLVLASINPNILRNAAALKFPVILVEGFGRIPFNATAYRLLTSNEKRDAALNATPWDVYTGERPEIIIPLPAAGGDPASDTVEFRAGQVVRIHGSPFLGQTGTINSLRGGSATLSNGLRAPAAELRLENGERALIPLANLDVLES
jgi:hypothetical protein